ncbi:tRNA (adenosine(37)-N6)-threonylcarbamoyltransferase complex transferase subunit TsaD [Candidatus Peregrinibacteria bacterium CG10_big_fil_rev_8_21_14_0_10_36_19]|nr:MAG: tRNA (adenosine(37)-N6)-threonylcarbamoyltransferase complex transferase subunit TsaD [Candidatus Peregrinibacteria bacterium CG10_big_fil_rev_8_21_14_0_10_36_19]
MRILSIETSCDETACAVVEDGVKVLANIISSQIDLHAKTGGVVPEVAAREHVLNMIPVLEECLEASGSNWSNIDALAVTQGPGLISSLIIGTETANVISYVKNLPLIPVQHIVGHIYSNWLDTEDEIEFPVLILTVSGGHNELILMRGHHDFEVLGATRDDASGEAFDKVARILGLGYPGGPAISKIAVEGNNEAYKFPRSYLDKGSFDFSFSGLKTAVLNEVMKGEVNKADVAASFQEAVCEVLVFKLAAAFEKYGAKEVHLAGGVSANLRLRELAKEKLGEKVKLRHPASIKYCTDNAAMIGSAAYYLWKKNPDKYTPSSNFVPYSDFSL